MEGQIAAAVCRQRLTCDQLMHYLDSLPVDTKTPLHYTSRR